MKVIVTGGSSGVGKATAAALAAAGHSAMIACRTISKGEQAAAEILGDVEFRYLDLADLSRVRAFADSVKTVDVLINNAGVLGLPLTRTADGFEAHMGTNHLGQFALTCPLAGRVPAAVRRAERSQGPTGHYPGADDGVAERDLPGATFQPVGKTDGDQAGPHRVRPGDSPSAVGTFGRTDRLRLGGTPELMVGASISLEDERLDPAAVPPTGQLAEQLVQPACRGPEEHPARLRRGQRAYHAVKCIGVVEGASRHDGIFPDGESAAWANSHVTMVG
jgi:NAD(P)-dependent dehydrogenase (short-subunit alcohol dehydrogenase family)